MKFILITSEKLRYLHETYEVLLLLLLLTSDINISCVATIRSSQRGQTVSSCFKVSELLYTFPVLNMLLISFRVATIISKHLNFAIFLKWLIIYTCFVTTNDGLSPHVKVTSTEYIQHSSAADVYSIFTLKLLGFVEILFKWLLTKFHNLCNQELESLCPIIFTC
jgi:hypothetical protein